MTPSEIDSQGELQFSVYFTFSLTKTRGADIKWKMKWTQERKYLHTDDNNSDNDLEITS